MRADIPVPMEPSTITDHEFAEIRRLMYENTGIHLTPAKKPMVCGRLGKRVRELGLSTYGEYLSWIAHDPSRQELRIAVDLLTTNETSFFREQKHFDFLVRYVTEHGTPGIPFRVWSAACSSGEEPYSIAMVIADVLGDAPWEVVGSDICHRVLGKAIRGQYPMERAGTIPHAFLTRYCLKGIGSQEGTFLIDRRLRSRVQFLQLNLNAALPKLGPFDVIFLRNVMIYFDHVTKRRVLERVVPMLKPGGYFLIGHSESVNGITDAVDPVAPAIYRKPLA